MDEYAGRVLAGRYRLPRRPDDGEPLETRAFDTYSGQEVVVREVPLPEIVEAELIDGDQGGAAGGDAESAVAVRRALETARAAAAIPDHPRLDQVFDVFEDGGSIWIVSELVPGRSLASILGRRSLSPFRAAEVAADILTALRALHAHGWAHRNITARTVLVCDDGRIVLSGLAAGAAQDALCGYDPLPPPPGWGQPPRPAGSPGPPPGGVPSRPMGPDGRVPELPGPASGFLPAAGSSGVPRQQGLADRLFAQAQQPPNGRAALEEDGAAARARQSAAATYRAGTRAAAARIAGGPSYTDQVDTGEHPLPTHGPSLEEGGRGTATFGGSLPGPRPGASISVPVASAPQPVDPGVRREDDDAPSRRGPRTRLDAERARQTRMQIVGPVTERWAPEQAGPVHEHWQLAPPVGPAADLWALGALLFRAVQGHSAYPEESAFELCQLVCAEPPAMAEECGALRPVVESLLRQDPTERPDFEELRGWLRSLIRTAPEPDIGSRTVTVPPQAPRRSDPRRLPIKRRRGELVRRRRRGRDAMEPLVSTQGARHKRSPSKRPRRGARSLGRWLIALVFVAMVAAIAVAALLMPKAQDDGSNGQQRRQSVTGGGPDPGQSDKPERQEEQGGKKKASADPTRLDPGQLPKGFAMRKDEDGFEVAVRKDWQRLGHTPAGAVRFASPDGRYEMLVAPGRDTVEKYGSDPMDYQLDKEPELAPYRASAWGEISGTNTITVGTRQEAVGTFTWQDSGGVEKLGRNFAMIVGGRYHVVFVSGPISDRRSLDVFYQQAANTYTPKGF
ncbi:hypothetical protein SRB5_66790 [Streptomyces sp. RB5]|uniref:Protein kinase domain-containing protein n=1 Tax=Streptomyces smaragdinus TaxID=2585196 RepID=A0A7K0CSQ5_9ACTN|nr:protein kinase [Streptomyces smaragdinus]MQY16480.1 hypothetical protein [Streptomyces smaragdinus]